MSVYARIFFVSVILQLIGLCWLYRNLIIDKITFKLNPDRDLQKETLQNYNIEDHVNSIWPEKYFGTKFWRKYYPEVSDYIVGIEDGKYEWPVPIEDSTSSVFTELELLEPERIYKTSEHLRAVILAKDGLGKPKNHGGDYFHVRLVRLNSDGEPTYDAIATDAIDHRNGTYTLNVPLLWPGTIGVLVELVHPSEAVAQLLSWTSGFVGRGVTFFGTYLNGEQLECSVGLKTRMNSEIPCNFSQPEKGVSWYCYPPKRGGCTALNWITAKNNLASSIWMGNRQPLFRQYVNWKAKILNSGVSVFVEPTNYSAFSNLPPCSKTTGFSPIAFDRHLGHHTGLYSDGRWKSLQCSNPDTKNLARAPKCLKNKILYFIGDSTMRQWFLLLLKNLQMTEIEPGNPSVWQRPRTAERKDLNLTIIYRGHGSPLHGKGPPSSRPYIVDTLESIKQKNGANVFIVLNLALHFDLIDTAVYMKRIEAVKKSVITLKNRMPQITIFIRGCIRHKNSKIPVPTEWFSYRLCKIFIAIFSDLPYVRLVDVWPLTSAHLTLDNHPMESDVAQHIALFLSFICPEF